MKCPYCKVIMKKEKDVFVEDGIEYQYYKCPKCKEELMDMKQLGKVAKKYRNLKAAQKIKFTKWGNSIAVRVSKDFVDEYKIKPGDTGLMVKDGKDIRIIVG